MVMACGACGTLYATDATDEVGARRPTAFETFTGAAEQAGSAIASGAARAIDRVSGALQPAAPEPPRPARREATGDPLADEDAALEARFEELERRGARVRIED